MTLSLEGTLQSVLLYERSLLTLYVEEQVGANKGAHHHRDRQSAVRHHLSDSAIQIRTVGDKEDISTWCNSDVINSTRFTTVMTLVTLLDQNNSYRVVKSVGDISGDIEIHTFIYLMYYITTREGWKSLRII